MILDYYLVYQFVRRLSTPFREWDAYKLGIIDENGNVLKKRRELRTREEKQAFGAFDVMVLNLKKLIERLPAGKTRLASYAAALFLLREWNHFTPNSMLTESVSDMDIEKTANLFFNGYTDYNTLQENVNIKMHDINELFEQKFTLTELFDKPYPYSLVIKNVSARATITLPDNTRLVVSLLKKNGDEWDLIFERGGSMDATKAGDQYKVFSTVLAVVNEFIKKVKPEKITFGADKTESDSRSNLYNTMLKRFAKKAGYDFSSYDKYGATYFTLIKEDVPTVNVGSGNIPGLGIGPDGEPGFTREQQKKHKKRNKMLRRFLAFKEDAEELRAKQHLNKKHTRPTKPATVPTSSIT
jgi:hypothetical protein